MSKLIKRTLILFLSCMMLFGAAPIARFVDLDFPSLFTYKAKAATYSASDAINYANSHWNDGVGLCAEFVSKCLNAGGISIPNKAYYSSSTQSYENNSGTLGAYTNPYTCSASLLLYLSSRYTVISNPSNSQISAGDIVFMYSMSNGELRWKDGHVGICIKNNGTAIYAAHNKATNTGSFSSSYPCTYVVKMGGHIHDYNGEGNEELHPHKIYRICSCGDWYYTGETTKRSDCLTCYPPTLSVYYNANGGSTSSDTYKISSGLVYNKSDSTKYCQSWTYDKAKENGLVNGIKTFGLYKNGYKFVGWSTKASGGTLLDDDDTTIKPSDMSSDIKNGSCSVTLYAQWVPNTLSVYFNANGGSTSSDTYKISSGLVYNKSDSTKYCQSWTYDETKENGLINGIKTFGLYKNGYKFVGWSTQASGGTILDDDDATIKPSDLSSNIKNGSCSVTLYAQWVPNTLSVYFNANGGSISSDTYKLSSNLVYNKSDSTKYYQKWTYNSAKENGLTNASTLGIYRTGYTFNGWGTKSTGGTVYGQGDNTLKPSDFNSDIINGNCSITLYAQWKANTYSIAFNGNGSTSGSMSKLSMTYGTAKNLTANAFVKTGYTFTGWNTKADGSGTTYADKASVKNLSATNGATITLYAQWKANTYSIAFNGNGSTSGSMSKLSMTYGTAKNLTANAFVKTGYTFTGWNTKADGSGTTYADKASVKNLTTTNGATVTLYAQWKANTYTIAFNGNGSTSGSMSKLSVTYGTAKNLPANAFAKTGYTFTGWNTKADGSGTTYADKASVKNLTATNGVTVTLYAQWKKNAVVTTYTLTYDANGGSGAPSAQSGATSYTISSITPKKSGYVFSGWSKKPSASIGNYKGGDTIVLTENTTLYAAWFKMPDFSSVEVEIRKPSRIAVSYGDSLILHADLSEALPAGWSIKWSASNGNFDYTVSADGTTCTITPSKSGDTVFTATVYDAEDNEICKDEQTMTSKAGFFQKLAAFFKKIFGLTKTYPEAFKGTY